MPAELSLDQIQWAAEEVARQHPGAWNAVPVTNAVYKMCYALYNTQYNCSDKPGRYYIDRDRISIINYILLPDDMGDYRRVQVMFRNGTVAAHEPEEIPDAVSRLISHVHDPEMAMTPDEFCREFLVIHPFRDGNGRTAAILYNLLNDSLDKPVQLPDFFGVH